MVKKLLKLSLITGIFFLSTLAAQESVDTLKDLITADMNGTRQSQNKVRYLGFAGQEEWKSKTINGWERLTSQAKTSRINVFFRSFVEEFKLNINRTKEIDYNGPKAFIANMFNNIESNPEQFKTNLNNVKMYLDHLIVPTFTAIQKDIIQPFFTVFKSETLTLFQSISQGALQLRTQITLLEQAAQNNDTVTAQAILQRLIESDDLFDLNAPKKVTAPQPAPVSTTTPAAIPLAAAAATTVVTTTTVPSVTTPQQPPVPTATPSAAPAAATVVTQTKPLKEMEDDAVRLLKNKVFWDNWMPVTCGFGDTIHSPVCQKTQTSLARVTYTQPRILSIFGIEPVLIERENSKKTTYHLLPNKRIFVTLPVLVTAGYALYRFARG